MDASRLSFESAASSSLESRVARVARAAETAGGERETEQVAKDLESVFASLLVKEMRRGMADGFFGEGATGDVYGGWFDEHVGRALGEAGALDLAGLVKAGLGKSAAGAVESALPAAKPAEDGR